MRKYSPTSRDLAHEVSAGTRVEGGRYTAPRRDVYIYTKGTVGTHFRSHHYFTLLTTEH
jgi:hypothetical protein